MNNEATNAAGINNLGQSFGVSSLNQWAYRSEPLAICWEYQTLPRMDALGFSVMDLRALNEAGAAGWEVCLIVRDTYLMKRMGYRQATRSTT
ncbi:MAG TPA: hypothetical protein VJO13_18995 [Ktedonobacterales bacterium]|nr:hypothetical protein [Ktedonobacterales bacterium]